MRQAFFIPREEVIRMNCIINSSPFDDSALPRLKRMGLLSATGEADRDAIALLAIVCAGLLFDTLCDYHQCYDDVKTTLDSFLQMAEGTDVQQKFLLLCLQYDAIYAPIPDPIWWISGNSALCELFSELFIQHIQTIYETC